MRIHLIADPHADFTADKLELPDVECDLHLICGDGAAPLTHALPIIAEALQRSPAIKAYIPGNHDFYHTSEQPNSFLQDELARGREMGRKLGINVLSNDALIVGDTRVLGTTLWTNFGAGDTMSRKQKMALSQKGWYGDERRDGGGRGDYHEDFRQIRYGASGSKNRFTPSQWLVLHEEAMAFLRKELAFDHIGETVVATHMAPSVQSLMPGQQHMHDWLYATTDCDDLFQHVDLWCHGHIHAGRDYEIDGCRILCNPRGYPNRGGGFENASWDPAMVVELERRYAPKFAGM